MSTDAVNDKQSREIVLTQGELEIRLAAERVQTSLAVLIDDFRDHKNDDKDEFHDLGVAISQATSKIDALPQTLLTCQAALRKEADEKFVSRKETRVAVAVVAALQILFGIMNYQKTASAPDRFTATQWSEERKLLKEELRRELRR